MVGAAAVCRCPPFGPGWRLREKKKERKDRSSTRVHWRTGTRPTGHGPRPGGLTPVSAPPHGERMWPTILIKYFSQRGARHLDSAHATHARARHPRSDGRGHGVRCAMRITRRHASSHGAEVPPRIRAAHDMLPTIYNLRLGTGRELSASLSSWNSMKPLSSSSMLSKNLSISFFEHS